MDQTRLRQQLENLQKEKNTSLKYVYLQKLADALRKEGELEYALRVYGEALIIARRMHDIKQECETLIDLGSTYHDLGKPDKAVNYYRQAFQLVHETGNFNMQSRIYTKLSRLFEDVGNFELAEECFTQAKKLTRMAKRTTVIVSGEGTPTRFLTTPNQNARRVLTQAPESQSFATLNAQFNQRKHIRDAERGIIFVASILCLFVLILVGKGFLSLSPISLFAGIVIVSLLGVIGYVLLYRFR